MNRTVIGGWRLRGAQFGLLAAIILIWHVFTDPELLPPIYFDNADQAAFFFGRPAEVASRIWNWFASGEIYRHLGIT